MSFKNDHFELLVKGGIPCGWFLLWAAGFFIDPSFFELPDLLNVHRLQLKSKQDKTS